MASRDQNEVQGQNQDQNQDQNQSQTPSTTPSTGSDPPKSINGLFPVITDPHDPAWHESWQPYRESDDPNAPIVEYYTLRLSSGTKIFKGFINDPDHRKHMEANQAGQQLNPPPRKPKKPSRREKRRQREQLEASNASNQMEE